MYSPRELEAFIAVSDAGSVNAAAGQLFRTQPTVSRQLASLERDVGARLFRRTPAGMLLTASGERFEPMARDLVRRSRRAVDVMATAAGRDPGFVVACPEMTSMLVMAPFVAAGGRVADVIPAPPDDVYSKLKFGADVAVNSSAPKSGLQSRPLVSMPLQCQVMPGDDLAAADAVELTDVLARPFVVPGRGSSVRERVRMTAERVGLSLELERTASNAPMAQAQGAAGAGPALVLEPPQFGLVSRPLRHDGAALNADFFAAWEHGHYAHADIARMVETLADFMLERRTEMGWVAHPPRP